MLFVIFIIFSVLISIILLISGIAKKRKSFCIASAVFFILGCFLSLWMISDSAIDKRQIDPNQISLTQRFKLAFQEIKDPYDPCLGNQMDGPILSSTDNKLIRHILHDDFAIIIDPSLDLDIFPLSKVEFPEYFFSISKAAYGIRESVIKQQPAIGKQWMMQITGTSEIQSELSFDFIIGEGKLDFSCPHYFKIQSKASVSASGKIYQYRDDKPVIAGTITGDNNRAGLTPDREIGVNLMNLKSKQNAR